MYVEHITKDVFQAGSDTVLYKFKCVDRPDGKERSTHRASFESFLEKEWPLVKHGFQDLLQSEKTEFIIDNEGTPEIPQDAQDVNADDGNNLLMATARVTSKKPQRSVSYRTSVHTSQKAKFQWYHNTQMVA